MEVEDGLRLLLPLEDLAAVELVALLVDQEQLELLIEVVEVVEDHQIHLLQVLVVMVVQVL